MHAIIFIYIIYRMSINIIYINIHIAIDIYYSYKYYIVMYI